MMVGKLIYKLDHAPAAEDHPRRPRTEPAAQMFFRGHGFHATKLLRKYYEDSGEDAYQMELRAPAY